MILDDYVFILEAKMKITAKTLYAIVAVAELGKKKGFGNIKAVTIAEKFDFPVRFLELTLSELKGSGLVDSKRGTDGGFYLIKEPEDIALLDIVEAIEGSVQLLDCSKIVKSGECFVEEIFQEISFKIVDYMQGVSLVDIMEKLDQRDNDNIMDFVI